MVFPKIRLLTKVGNFQVDFALAADVKIWVQLLIRCYSMDKSLSDG